jgi:hypothetical protein
MMNQDDPDEWERDKALGREELGDDAARMDALRGDNPQEQIEDLRGDPDFQVAIARADCIVKLRRWFREEGGWQANQTRSGSLGDASAGVEWTYHGIHAQDGAFNGLRASNREVTVRGFTMMGIDDDGRFKIRRYIDWAGLFAQLGLTLNWRIPLTHPDYGDTGEGTA